MIKSILLTAILTMLIAFNAGSQTINLPVSAVKRVMVRVENLKLDSVQLSVCNQLNNELRNVNVSQTNTINNLTNQVMTEHALSSNYQSQIQILKKEVSRQKRNKVFAVIGGILTTSAMGYLFITK